MSDIKWVTVQLPDWLVINLVDGILDGEIKNYKGKLQDKDFEPDREEAQYFKDRIEDLQETIESLRGPFEKIMRGEA